MPRNALAKRISKVAAMRTKFQEAKSESLSDVQTRFFDSNLIGFDVGLNHLDQSMSNSRDCSNYEVAWCFDGYNYIAGRSPQCDFQSLLHRCSRWLFQTDPPPHYQIDHVT